MRRFHRLRVAVGVLALCSGASAVVEAQKPQDKVDLILGPYGSPITQAVADVAEKYQQPMVTHASTTSIFKEGRKFVFMVLSPTEGYLEGLVETAAKRGLKTVAIINEDTLFARAVADGTAELARRKALEVVLVQGHPKGNVEFSTILNKVRAANPVLWPQELAPGKPRFPTPTWSQRR